MSLASPSDRRWYPDTGASNHVAKSPEQFQNLVPYQGNCKVYTGDGSPLPITHVGTLSLSSPLGNIQFKNVFLVKKVTYPLYLLVNLRRIDSANLNSLLMHLW